MIPFKLVDTAFEAGVALRLYQRGDEFSIRVDKAGELMNSRAHHSEEVLAEVACRMIANRQKPHLLVGGLGMGFTLAAVLSHTVPEARVTVAELIPAVVRWNREFIGQLAGAPLADARVHVMELDVGQVMRQGKNSFDAIMLDVDNGPSSFTHEDNDALYSLRGLKLIYDALKPGGVFTVWSASTDPAFTQRMIKTGFNVSEQRVGSHASKRGNRHNIWIGVRPDHFSI
ncbi:spermidine synthase [Gallionella capsiferriformans]|uniref:Spermine synthase n=1 Tax=Gallionella capsiferriformans (strain ES-2) TaxID=395494 RepID=D9SFQ8_GALCS|nr:spermine synthase [Gallionella capsiferriformans]ADL55355.1 Spermine synthase [Gallionella capsiferriformans ES-2]